MEELKRMKSVSKRLKVDNEIPENMRLKYDILNDELDIISGDYHKLKERIAVYRLLKNDSISVSIFKELIDIKNKTGEPEAKNLFN